MEIRAHTGPREELRPLFALAEDSPERLTAMLGRGRVLVATDGGRMLGAAQLVPAGDPGAAELLGLAVAEDVQGRGIGRALVERAVATCRDEGLETLLVATATASTGNLRFYQRLGFRMLRVERDAFTVADGYPPGMEIEGIPLRDRIWLSLEL